MVQDKDYSIFYEVVVCFYPTDLDSVGEDGLYVKSIRQIRADELRNEAVDAGADESTKEVRTEE